MRRGGSFSGPRNRSPVFGFFLRFDAQKKVCRGYKKKVLRALQTCSPKVMISGPPRGPSGAPLRAHSEPSREGFKGGPRAAVQCQPASGPGAASGPRRTRRQRVEYSWWRCLVRSVSRPNPPSKPSYPPPSSAPHPALSRSISRASPPVKPSTSAALARPLSRHHPHRRPSTFTSLRITSLHFTSLHFTGARKCPLHFTSLHFTPFHFTSLRFTRARKCALHFTSLHFTLLAFTSLHSISFDWCTEVHNSLHLTSLHFISLHFTHFSSADLPSNFGLGGPPRGPPRGLQFEDPEMASNGPWGPRGPKS